MFTESAHEIMRKQCPGDPRFRSMGTDFGVCREPPVSPLDQCSRSAIFTDELRFIVDSYISGHKKDRPALHSNNSRNLGLDGVPDGADSLFSHEHPEIRVDMESAQFGAKPLHSPAIGTKVIPELRLPVFHWFILVFVRPKVVFRLSAKQHHHCRLNW